MYSGNYYMGRFGDRRKFSLGTGLSSASGTSLIFSNLFLYKEAGKLYNI